MSSQDISAKAVGQVPARERIIDAAGPLFYREGYRAIGVDRVIAEAGVAKATFYKHFPSKDDLIVAWIERAESFLAVQGLDENSATPLTDYADAMIEMARQERCLGCTFQSSAAEFADCDHPAHSAALAVKRRFMDQLQLRADRQGLADAEAISEMVFLLIEGVWAAVRMFGAEAPLANAKKALRLLTA